MKLHKFHSEVNTHVRLFERWPSLRIILGMTLPLLNTRVGFGVSLAMAFFVDLGILGMTLPLLNTRVGFGVSLAIGFFVDRGIPQ